MKILKRINSGATAAVLALSTLLSLGIGGVAFANPPQTCVWTGTAGDGKFSTAGNWSGSSCNNSVPQTGDIVSFGTLSTTPPTLTDDLGYALGGLIITQNGSSTATNYTVNALTLASGATIDQTQAENGSSYTNFTVTNAITAQGALTILGGAERVRAGTWSIAGVLTLSSGAYFSDTDVGSNGVVVQNGSSLTVIPSSASTTVPNFPITLGGGSSSVKPFIEFQPYASGGSVKATSYAFANPITLASDATVLIDDSGTTVNQTGSISGAGFKLALDPMSATGSTLNLNPSSNTSSTVAGTQVGTGAGNAGQGNGGSAAVPKTPNTGFALIGAHPAVTLVATVVAAGAIVAIARTNRKLAPARATRKQK